MAIKPKFDALLDCLKENDFNITSGTNEATLLHNFNGTFLETITTAVSSNGTTITFTVEKSGTGDLTMVFSDGFSTLDCTPAASITLTAGSATSPQENYIYVLQSTKALTVSTSDWPSTEHIKVAFVVVQDAVTTQTDGEALCHQPWNDHATGTNGQGHLPHIYELIRLSQDGGHWHSGIAPTVTITTNVGTPDNVDISTTAGVTFQAHRHTVNAFDSQAGGKFKIVNDNTTPYKEVTDLNGELTDASGGSMSGKYFNLTLWGVGNLTGGFNPMMINLPTGSYNNLADATGDVDGYNVDNIPSSYTNESSTGFLIARFTFKHSAASGGTWTLENTTDLRGQNPYTVAGGGTGTTVTEFSDNQFIIHDNLDVSKELTFQASSITASNTRVVTALDVDGVMALSDAVLTSGSVPFINSSTQLDEDNTNFYWDNTNKRLSVGSQENTATINGVSFGATFSVHTEGGTDLLGLAEHRHSDTAGFGAHFVGLRSRGTEGSETVVQNNDVLVRLDALGHDGTDYEVAGQIDFEVDGTPGAGDMPGRIVFKTTADGSASPTERLRINCDGVLVQTQTTDNLLFNFTTDATTSDGINITANSMTNGVVMDITANALTNGDGIRLSSSSTNAFNRALFEANNTGATATLTRGFRANMTVGIGLEIFCSGSSPCAILDANGGDAHLRLTSDSGNASPTEGDLWRESDGLKYYDGTSEINLADTTRSAQFVVYDFATDNATGDGKFYFHIPSVLNGMNLVGVHAEVITAGTTGTEDIQIHNVTGAADMLSTKLTIDSGETGSDTAATPAVIDTANDDVATNDLLRVDIDAVQTTAAKGLIITLDFKLP